jgi:hypothetical protein
MSLFTDWNTLLLEEYFSPSKNDQNVWISTNRLELEGIGVHLGGANGLIEAVKQGPPWFHGDGDISTKAECLVYQRKWPNGRPDDYCDPDSENNQYHNMSAPTYLPYIALWVLAGSEVDRSGFYIKVSELTSSQFPSDARENMETVWKDLEQWSSIKIQGKLGRFKANILGNHKFVGMAYAQALVTQRDIDGISRLFGSCRLFPGQTLNNEHFEQLLEHGQNSYFLSKGLKNAMGDQDYKEHLRELLGSYLEFWDGTIPKRANSISNPVINQKQNHQLWNDELSIILQMKFNEENTFWEIGWRLPATEAGHSFELNVDGNDKVSAKLELAGTHLHCVSAVSQKNARNVLNKSAKESIESTLSYIGIDDDISERKIFLRKDKIRILAWDRPDPALSDSSLLEREMPVSGYVYLLYSQEEYSNLIHFLKNEGIAHQNESNDGLPDKWGLISISDTSLLTSEQRAIIIDEEPSNTPKARIRLIGGKPIIGAGNKKYAYYDLPIIELEAPAGTELHCSDLIFEELGDSENNLIKRFKFRLKEENKCALKITAKIGSEELCKVGLQVLSAGGLGVAKKDQFSLDKFGRAIFDSSGLLGASIGEKQANDVNIDYFQIDQTTLDELADIDILEYMKSNISALFLDSIASSINGSVSYGVARDQIRRLANDKGLDNIEPAILLRELRRRGHIEIETNVKGHMVRICTVPPTIYSLPIKDNEQRQLYGVCGSLRLQHWQELSIIVGCKIFFDRGIPRNLPTVRLAPFTQLSVSALENSSNFQVVNLPIQNLFQWVGSINERKENLLWYQEQGFSPNYLKKLNPTRGGFRDTENVLVDAKRKYELFKYEDQQIQGLSVYKFGENLGEGVSKYSFIQDSRWGVWMAINAFAEFVKTTYGILDASPWPLHYDSINGSLYMPARIEPPFVVERLLTLSGGDSPTIIQATGKAEDDSVLLSDKDQSVIGKVSLVYDEMANGKWLCYRWVPEKIAQKVATLLNGELQEFRSKIKN